MPDTHQPIPATSADPDPRPSACACAPCTPHAPGAPTRDVLVVEDDPEINQLVGAYAGLAGLNYRGAMTGEAALEELRRSPPALVVLDVMLPDLDGFEICRRIKGVPGTSQVPVIMLTAMDADDSRQRGLACGACAYLTKPFDPDALIEAIERHAGK